MAVGETVKTRSTSRTIQSVRPLAARPADTKHAKHRPPDANGGGKGPYELKLGPFRLKSSVARRRTSHAVRSAARSIAALGCTARACVLIRPEEVRWTTTVQRNERMSAESRRMTTSTTRTRITYGAIDAKNRYSTYRRLSSVIGTFAPETLIRTQQAKASGAPSGDD